MPQVGFTTYPAAPTIVSSTTEAGRKVQMVKEQVEAVAAVESGNSRYAQAALEQNEAAAEVANQDSGL